MHISPYMACRIDSQYKDVAEDFYTDPEEWLDSHYPEGPLLPTHLVIFNALKPVCEDFMSVVLI